MNVVVKLKNVVYDKNRPYCYTLKYILNYSVFNISTRVELSNVTLWLTQTTHDTNL